MLNEAIAQWSQVALSLIGMFCMGFCFIWAVKTDTRVLATKMGAMEVRLNRIDSTVEKLNDHQARLSVFDERLLAQGQRVDALQKELHELLMKR